MNWDFKIHGKEKYSVYYNSYIPGLSFKNMWQIFHKFLLKLSNVNKTN